MHQPRPPPFAPVVIVGGGPVGLFLASLLSHYQIPSVLLETQSVEQRFRHPAAHFLNTRTMEILASTLPTKVSTRIRQAMPPVQEWQTFTWARNLCDRNPLAKVVHPVHQTLQVGQNANGVLVPPSSTVEETLARAFPLTQPLSPCTVGHLAQHTLGRILYEHVQTLSSTVQCFYETPVTHVRTLQSHNNHQEHQQPSQQGPSWSLHNTSQPAMEICTQQGDVIRTNLCLAADGAHSLVRQQLQIPWQATTDPPLHQDLYNIHVRLNDAQVDQLAPPSMLTTTLNSTAIAMVVRHTSSEYNIQIPTFPPYQRLGPVEPLLASIFGQDVRESQVQSLSVWTMTSRVAQRYVQGAVALVGDAAHVFPPAGGFGLNTGLQDAHNLVWKLANVVANHKEGSSNLSAALRSYERERRPIALQNAALSIRNYQRLLEVTKQLYLDENHPQMLRKSLDASGAVLPLSFRQAMFDSLYQAALRPLAWLSDLQSSYRQHIQNRIQRKLQQGAGLPLLFPRFEVLFDYNPESDKKDASDSSAAYWRDSLCPAQVGLKVGRRLPYVPGEDFLTRPRESTPSFLLLFRQGHVDANLTAWLDTQLHAPVLAATSNVVPDADTVVLVRPDDMVAAVISRCSETPGFETLLLQAAMDSFHQA